MNGKVPSGARELFMFEVAKQRAKLLHPNAPFTWTDFQIQQLQSHVAELNRKLAEKEQLAEPAPRSVSNPQVAQRMRAHLIETGTTQGAFAKQVGCSDRAIRTFSRTGKIRASIMREIVQALDGGSKRPKGQSGR